MIVGLRTSAPTYHEKYPIHLRRGCLLNKGASDNNGAQNTVAIGQAIGII